MDKIIKNVDKILAGYGFSDTLFEKGQEQYPELAEKMLEARTNIDSEFELMGDTLMGWETWLEFSRTVILPYLLSGMDLIAAVKGEAGS